MACATAVRMWVWRAEAAEDAASRSAAEASLYSSLANSSMSECDSSTVSTAGAAGVLSMRAAHTLAATPSAKVEKFGSRPLFYEVTRVIQDCYHPRVWEGVLDAVYRPIANWARLL